MKKEIYFKRYSGDILNVGKNKPLGYLPLSTLEQCGISIEKAKSILNSKGINWIIFCNGDCLVGSGAIFAYDYRELKKILDKNIFILKENKWGEIPEKFVIDVAKKDVERGTKLFKLIAESFADYKNQGI